VDRSSIIISILFLLVGVIILTNIFSQPNEGIVNLIFGNFNKLLFGIISIQLGSLLLKLESRR
jgi:hypothetical protein